MNNDKRQTFILFTILLLISIVTLFVDNENLAALETHYKRCEYQKVITLAYKILHSNKLDQNEKARVYILKGISEFSLHQTLNSKITFLELLENNRNIDLSENEYSPKIITMLNELKTNFNDHALEKSINLPK